MWSGFRLVSARPWRRLGRPHALLMIALAAAGWIPLVGAESRPSDSAEHWAYQSLHSAEPPTVQVGPFSDHPVDRFVAARLRSADVAPSPRAPRHVLIKRLSYDLIGLPPTPAEVEAFVNDKSPDAYEKLVDRLLASPHFGERWGRHWLDKARYADSDGYEKDRPRANAWRYRDWVIAAINNDMPFDQFTIEQLAGDLLPGATPMQRLATAFHRQTLTNTEGGTDKEEFRVAAVFDRVNTTGAIWMGLTVACAQCHDHKYDAMSQREYFQLYAFFNNGDEANTSVPKSVAAQSQYATLKKQHDAKVAALESKRSARRNALLAELDKHEAALRAQLAKRPANAVAFHPITFDKLEASEGVRFDRQDDGSYLVTGSNPAKGQYTLWFKSDLAASPGVTGLRIETLADKRLPSNGPGRVQHGNFVLSDVRFYAATTPKLDKNHRVALKSAKADFAQDNWPAAAAIDPKLDTGWAVGPQFGKPHHIDITTTKPLIINGTAHMQVVLDQQYGSQHTIGRFRVSLRTGSEPNDGMPGPIVNILKGDATKRTAKQRDTLLDYVASRDKSYAELSKELDALKKQAPASPNMTVRVIAQRGSPRQTRVLIRGDFLRPGDPVTGGTLNVMHKFELRADGPTVKLGGDRLDLAHWLVDPANPLTPRVAVNHVWKHLFGHGLVRTVDDFGVRGEKPTHPQLLDWLAAEFIRLKWSRKALIKTIVMSQTYQQSSKHRPELAERDPENRLLHRQNRFRVEAEIVRDLALSASGLLSDKVGGPSVYPPLPAGIASLSYANNFKWNTSKGEDRFRRGMYTFFKRTSPHPNLLTFDCPDSNTSNLTRNISNTPLMALTTLNNITFVEASQALAKRLVSRAANNDVDRLQHGFNLTVARDPAPHEVESFSKLLETSRSWYATRSDDAKKLVGGYQPEGVSPAEAAAWVVAARVMLNMDEFLTRE